MTTDVIIHPHARDRAAERGVTEAKIRQTVALGVSSPARFGRTVFRREFPFNVTWRGRIFATKQVEVYAVREQDNWLAITVIACYF
jgi:hypothetical protein